MWWISGHREMSNALGPPGVPGPWPSRRPCSLPPRTNLSGSLPEMPPSPYSGNLSLNGAGTSLAREWRRGGPWDRLDTCGAWCLGVGGGSGSHKGDWEGGRGEPPLRSACRPSPSHSLCRSSALGNLTPLEAAAGVGSRVFIVGRTGRRPGPSRRRQARAGCANSLGVPGASQDNPGGSCLGF